jgi:hypothetical protein
MMSNFSNWYIRNQDAITWFIIGWLVYACGDAVSEGRYGWAVFNAALAYANYAMRNFRI